MSVWTRLQSVPHSLWSEVHSAVESHGGVGEELGLPPSSARPSNMRQPCSRLSQSNEKRKAMIDHIYLPVSDLKRSSEFYKKVLEPLGIDMPYKGDQPPMRGFAINNIPGFWLKNGEVAKDLYVACRIHRQERGRCQGQLQGGDRR